MNILLFVTPKPNLKRTVRLTREVASATQAKVYLLAVCKSKDHQDECVVVINQAKEILGDYVADSHIRFGKRKMVLLSELMAGNYDLLIYGYLQVKGRESRKPSLLAREVISQANVSVIVVRKAHPEINKLLICTSGIVVAKAVIQAGVRIARGLQAKVTLLHVVTAVPSMYTGLDEIDETLSELLDTDTPIARELRQGAEILASSDVDAELRLRHGVVVDEIMREIEVGDHDLIVLGASRADRGLQPWLLGDVTSKIVEQSNIPVMIISHEQASIESDQEKDGL